MNTEHEVYNIDIENLKEEHAKFIQKCGVSSTQLDAEEHLKRTIMCSRVKYVINVMCSIGAIDQIRTVDSGGDNTNVVYNLIKNGYYSTVSVATNGQMIVLFTDPQDGDIYTGIKTHRERFYNISDKEFDWDEFAIKLLDYIHMAIYHSAHAYALSIFGRKD